MRKICGSRKFSANARFNCRADSRSQPMGFSTTTWLRCGSAAKPASPSRRAMTPNNPGGVAR